LTCNSRADHTVRGISWDFAGVLLASEVIFWLFVALHQVRIVSVAETTLGRRLLDVSVQVHPQCLVKSAPHAGDVLFHDVGV
jgi:hypothetical protein